MKVKDEDTKESELKGEKKLKERRKGHMKDA